MPIDVLDHLHSHTSRVGNLLNREPCLNPPGHPRVAQDMRDHMVTQPSKLAR